MESVPHARAGCVLCGGPPSRVHVLISPTLNPLKVTTSCIPRGTGLPYLPLILSVHWVFVSLP